VLPLAWSWRRGIACRLRRGCHHRVIHPRQQVSHGRQ
jgi:hypothetical protein